MKPFIFNVFLDGKILGFLSDHELQPLRKVCRTWEDLISGILHKRKGLLVPLEVPPDWNNASLESVLNEVFSPNPLHRYKIEPIAGGFSIFAKVYRLTVNGEKYVVRSVGNPNPYDVVRETTLTGHFSNKRIAPTMHYCSVDRQVVIIGFIADTTPMWMVAMTSSLLKEIAESLLVVHSGPIFPLTDKIGALIRISDEKLVVYNLVTRFGHLEPYSHLLPEMEKIERFISATHCCHNDLSPTNMLFNGEKLHFIDWEIAGKSDPFLDLAAISTLLRLTPEHEELFLSSYFKRELSAQEVAKLFLFKQLLLMQKAVSFLAKISSLAAVFSLNTEGLPPISQWSPVEIPIDYLTDEGKYFLSIMFLKECMRNIATSEYTSALGTMEEAREHTFQIVP